MDCVVHGVTKTQTGLSDFHFHFQALGGLTRWHQCKEPPCQSRRHKRYRFDPWIGKIPWRRAWPPTPVSFPGESCGQRSLGGYSSQGCKESNTTEASQQQQVALASLCKEACRTERPSCLWKCPPLPRALKKSASLKIPLLSSLPGESVFRAHLSLLHS